MTPPPPPPEFTEQVETPLLAEERKRRPKKPSGAAAPPGAPAEQEAYDPLGGLDGAIPVRVEGERGDLADRDEHAPDAPPVDEEVIRHLLFHKALTFDGDGNERIESYVAMARESQEGEHVAIRDPFDRSIALALELVIQERLDPWHLDLVQFSSLYLKHAEERDLDLVTAGRILLMAWTVLKLQSDELAEKAEKKEEPPTDGLAWDEIPDWHLGDEAWDYNRLVQSMPKPPFDEPVRHHAPRKVTLMELVDAFEEIRHEAMLRQQVNRDREFLKAKMAKDAQSAVQGMVHRDDPEADIQDVWRRVQRLDHAPTPLATLAEGDADGVVKAFNAVLFLANWGRVKVWQRGFPYGPIYVRRRAAPEAKPAEAKA